MTGLVVVQKKNVHLPMNPLPRGLVNAQSRRVSQANQTLTPPRNAPPNKL